MNDIQGILHITGGHGRVTGMWLNGDPVGVATWLTDYMPHPDADKQADRFSRQKHALLQRFEKAGVIESSESRLVDPTIEIIDPIIVDDPSESFHILKVTNDYKPYVDPDKLRPIPLLRLPAPTMEEALREVTTRYLDIGAAAIYNTVASNMPNHRR